MLPVVEETSFFANRATGHSKVTAPGAWVEIFVEIDRAWGPRPHTASRRGSYLR